LLFEEFILLATDKKLIVKVPTGCGQTEENLKKALTHLAFMGTKYPLFASAPYPLGRREFGIGSVLDARKTNQQLLEGAFARNLSLVIGDLENAKYDVKDRFKAAQGFSDTHKVVDFELTVPARLNRIIPNLYGCLKDRILESLFLDFDSKQVFPHHIGFVNFPLSLRLEVLKKRNEQITSLKEEADTKKKLGRRYPRSVLATGALATSTGVATAALLYQLQRSYKEGAAPEILKEKGMWASFCGILFGSFTAVAAYIASLKEFKFPSNLHKVVFEDPQGYAAKIAQAIGSVQVEINKLSEEDQRVEELFARDAKITYNRLNPKSGE